LQSWRGSFRPEANGVDRERQKNAPAQAIRYDPADMAPGLSFSAAATTIDRSSKRGRPVRIRQGKKGIAVRLFELEAEIMDVVWSRHMERFAVSDVLAVLERRRDIAYTTVMTTLARLYEKGVLDRHREGKRYLYSPRLTREEFLQSTARDVLRGLGDSSAQQALALLVETVSSADQGTLDELERVIMLRRKELES
jgi:predicted transcriptional regulator